LGLDAIIVYNDFYNIVGENRQSNKQPIGKNTPLRLLI